WLKPEGGCFEVLVVWLTSESYPLFTERDHSKLCALCDVPSTCEYRAGISSNHLGALECLHRGLGDVAYVDREIIKTYFGMAGNEGFSFLCRNGTLEPLTSEQPCTWVQQRWDAVVARNDVAAALKASLLLALPSISANRRLDWTDNLANVMLKESSYVVQEVVTTNLKSFIQEGE
ncbi:unnamed protein product, partial [Timema podura]|nr:unnamed protein product [Timema podura]